jgi:hypothetical protein
VKSLHEDDHPTVIDAQSKKNYPPSLLLQRASGCGSLFAPPSTFLIQADPNRYCVCSRSRVDPLSLIASSIPHILSVCFPPSQYIALCRAPNFANPGEGHEIKHLSRGVALASLIKIIQGAQHALPLDQRASPVGRVACRTSAKTFYYINNNAFHARKILFEIKSCFLHRALFGVRAGPGSRSSQLA